MCSTQGGSPPPGSDDGAGGAGSDELVGGRDVPLVEEGLAVGCAEDGRAGADSEDGRSGRLGSAAGPLECRGLGGGTVVMSSVPSLDVVGGLLSSTPPAPSVRSGISITRISVTRADPSYAVLP